MHFEHTIASYISVITWGSCTHSAPMQVQQRTHQSNILRFNNNITPEDNNTIFSKYKKLILSERIYPGMNLLAGLEMWISEMCSIFSTGLQWKGT